MNCNIAVKTLGVVGLLALALGSASADVVTFNPLTGSNGDPYSGHVEAGFTITPTAGAWLKAFIFGNPVRDIFSRSDTAAITVTGCLPFPVLTSRTQTLLAALPGPSPDSSAVSKS